MRQQKQLVCTQYYAYACHALCVVCHACHALCVVCHVTWPMCHVTCVTRNKSSTLREFSLMPIVITVSLAFWWYHLPTGWLNCVLRSAHALKRGQIRFTLAVGYR
jgi:hypothetical protein